MKVKLTPKCKRILLHLDILENARISEIIKRDMEEYQTFKLIETTKTFHDPQELELHWQNLIKTYWRGMFKLSKYGLVEKSDHKYKLSPKGRALVKLFHDHPLLLLKEVIEIKTKEGDDGCCLRLV